MLSLTGCRATIAQIRQHSWVARDYKPCCHLQHVSSAELPDYAIQEGIQPHYLSKVS